MHGLYFPLFSPLSVSPQYWEAKSIVGYGLGGRLPSRGEVTNRRLIRLQPGEIYINDRETVHTLTIGGKSMPITRGVPSAGKVGKYGALTSILYFPTLQSNLLEPAYFLTFSTLQPSTHSTYFFSHIYCGPRISRFLSHPPRLGCPSKSRPSSCQGFTAGTTTVSKS